MKDRFGQKLMWWRIRTVMPFLRGRVLDVGCGTNDLVRTYRRRAGTAEARRSVGVDVYDWTGRDKVVPDSGHLPWPDGSFDTITIVAALNHIPDRARTLAECRRLVRPGGSLVVTMLPPTLSRWWHVVRKPWDADQTERGIRPGEVWGLTRAQVVTLLRDAGFEPTRHKRFMAGVNLLTTASPVQTGIVPAFSSADVPGTRPDALRPVMEALMPPPKARPASSARASRRRNGPKVPRDVEPVSVPLG